MARVEVVMPKMGESIMEGTVIEWSKNVGDQVEQDETLLEIATDKVDSEVPAPETGVLLEKLAEAGDTIEVGQVIAIMDTDPSASADTGKEAESKPEASEKDSSSEPEASSKDEPEEAPAEPAAKSDSSSGDNGRSAQAQQPEQTAPAQSQDTPEAGSTPPQRQGSDGRFFSPLVRSIAQEEGISQEELEKIEGSGSQGRVTKQDIMNYLEQRKSAPKQQPASQPVQQSASAEQQQDRKPQTKKTDDSEIRAGELEVDWPRENVEVIKMDRMRKVIADHMIKSKKTSAHVTTFAEADVTNLVHYREKMKNQFERENGFKLTFTPFFIEATIQALREYPLLNASVDGDEILLHRDINYGMAVALGQSGSGGLVVPVIKNAGELNLRGIANKTHELANRARNKQLSPDDLVGGTFTLTNYGSVGNLMGTPIINQPQVGIFGTGVIEKRPVVRQLEGQDAIVIRHMVYLSMSYDHRIIDGALGGSFVQRVKHLLENFDVNRSL